MASWKVLAMSAAAALALAGCSTVEDAFSVRKGYYTQNTPDLSDEDVSLFVAKQNNIWNCFVSLAGLPAEVAGQAEADCDSLAADTRNRAPGAPARLSGSHAYAIDPTATQALHASGGYRAVVNAGIHYADVRCDRFLDAVFWFNRMRETASRQVQYVGAASAAALAVIEASKHLIGLAPLGITLIDQTVNNIGQGLLFNLPPHIVRTLIEKQQQAYVKGLAEKYSSKIDALRAIQGYAALCLPVSIETEVNRSVAAAEYEPVTYDNTKPKLEPGKDGKAAVESGTGTDEQPAQPADEGTSSTPPENHVPSVDLKDPDRAAPR